MKKQLFFRLAIFAASLALILHIVARDQSIKSTTIRAQSWNHSEGEKQVMKADADHYAWTADVIFYIGLVFTFSSLICLLAARYRNEPGWFVIPILLLLFDLMVQRLL